MSLNIKSFINVSFKKEDVENNPNKKIFYLEPLSEGIANTIGNLLRRTLLSYVPSVAIFAIRINNYSHEYSTIPGVVEPITKIILNIKKIIIKKTLPDVSTENNYTFKLNVKKGQKLLKAQDIECPIGFEIVNPKLVIANLSQDVNLNIELYGKFSFGYKTFIQNKQELIDVISIDSNYTPVVYANYFTDVSYMKSTSIVEKLKLVVETNGAITPEEALQFSIDIVKAHLNFFDTKVEPYTIKFIDNVETNDDNFLKKSINFLGLSIRSYNCLLKEGIDNLNKLTNKTENEIFNIKNLGKKSFLEIKEKILKLGLTFRKEG